MSTLIDLIIRFKELPFREDDTPAPEEETDYSPLGLTEADVPHLIELSRLNSSMFDDSQDDEEEIWNLLSVMHHARLAFASMENPAHFQHFHQLLLESYKNGDESYHESLPHLLVKLGPDIIPHLLNHFSQAHEAYRESTNEDHLWHMQDLSACLSPFAQNTNHFNYNSFRTSITNTLSQAFLPIEAALPLNEQLLSTCIVWQAREALPEIRAVVEKDLIDLAVHGDLEEIEIAFSLRTERATPIPCDTTFNATHSLELRKKQLTPPSPQTSLTEAIDYYLSLYRSSGSLTNHTELAGYLAARSIVTPQPELFGLNEALWSGHSSVQYDTPWLTDEDANSFFQIAETFHDPIFLAVKDLTYTLPEDLPSWCRGFLIGIKDEKNSNHDLKVLFTDLLISIKEPSEKPLTVQELDQARTEITPKLHTYTERYLQIEATQRSGGNHPTSKPAPTKRSAPKINRNSPCPCGSGIKYKQCCLNR